MSAPEPDATWDQKVGRSIRRFFGGLTGRMSEIDAWESAKLQALERQQKAARTRSSQELHEELERLEREDRSE